jgi:hypothetical protein
MDRWFAKKHIKKYLQYYFGTGEDSTKPGSIPGDPAILLYHL